jgi:hypothetical protein
MAPPIPSQPVAALGAERAAAVIARIVAALDVPVSPTTR